MFTDLPYGTEHDRQVLDVYPAKGHRASPILFFIHGGGWSDGDKKSFEHIGNYYSSIGFCTVVINYRLSPEVKHPMHVLDSARAFAWTKEHVAAYGGDPSRINLMGHSSGGHVAALLSSDPSYLATHGRSPKEIRKCVGISGVYSLKLMATLPQYRGVFADLEDETASPVNYMPACHTLLVYGENDYPSMPRQTGSYWDVIVGGGGRCDVCVAAGESHDSIVANAGDPRKNYVAIVTEFLA